MPKYKVTIIHGCTTSVDVEADSVEEAREKAYESDQSQPSICHQCAKEIELGDAYKTIVYDEDYQEVGKAV